MIVGSIGGPLSELSVMATPASAAPWLVRPRPPCLGRPGALLWNNRPQPQSQPAQLLSTGHHRRQGRAATLQLKAAPTTRREEGEDSEEMLRAWKRRLGGAANGSDGSTDEANEGFDLLDSTHWDPATQQEWAQFVQQSGARDCKWWDAGDVDPGLPPMHVDLDRD